MFCLSTGLGREELWLPTLQGSILHRLRHSATRIHSDLPVLLCVWVMMNCKILISMQLNDFLFFYIISSATPCLMSYFLRKAKITQHRYSSIKTCRVVALAGCQSAAQIKWHFSGHPVDVWSKKVVIKVQELYELQKKWLFVYHFCSFA